jgi:polar amino acid transport system substrate-binding protein
MPQLRYQAVNVLSITLLILSIVCVSGSPSLSQNLDEIGLREIRVGIRNAAFPIGDAIQPGQYRGFCADFVEQLKNELSRQNQQISVRPLEKPLENQYRGEGYPRFGALLAKIAEIECGPNSRQSLDLPIDATRKDSRIFRDEIAPSTKDFYRTGIKLLVKSDTAEELRKASPDELKNKLLNLPIAVVRQTTTLQAFSAQQQYYKQFVPYPRDQSLNPLYDVRDLALDALENDQVKAFASDAVILQTLFQKGVTGQPEYRKERPAYKDAKDINGKRYEIFPDKGYLPNLEEQQYVMAVRKKTGYQNALIDLIDNVLGNRSLDKAVQAIRDYESTPTNIGFGLPSIDWGAFWTWASDKGVAIITALISAAGVVLAARIAHQNANRRN